MNIPSVNSPVSVSPYPTVDFGADTGLTDLQASTPDSAALAPAAGTTDVDKVSTDFEAVFLSQMLGAMFAGDDLTAYFGGGTAGDVYKSFLMNEYGKAIAKNGGIGIAEQVKKELLKLQEVAA